MFNNNKIKKLSNEINALNNTSNKNTENGDTNYQVKCKITGNVRDDERDLYLYSFVAVNNDNTINPYGICGTNAICINEIGTDPQSPTVENDTIVMIQSSINGYEFMVGGGSILGSLDPILDLTQNDDTKDTTGWEDGYETTSGEITGEERTAVKFKTLVRTHYDFEEDLNYEYYRVLEFDDKGILRKVNMVVEVEGFETTLHEHN